MKRQIILINYLFDHIGSKQQAINLCKHGSSLGNIGSRLLGVSTFPFGLGRNIQGV